MKVAWIAVVYLNFSWFVFCDETKQDTKGNCQKMVESVIEDALQEVEPIFLYKVLSINDWEKSRETVLLSKADADFIHFSTKEQLNRILEKYWADVSDYVILKVEAAKLPGELVFEANPGGVNKYYHLYHGFIPLSAVVDANIKK